MSIKERIYQKQESHYYCDTKKKELIGDLHRGGATYSKVEQVSYDHDFPALSKGSAVPPAFYDVVRNQAHIKLE